MYIQIRTRYKNLELHRHVAKSINSLRAKLIQRANTYEKSIRVTYSIIIIINQLEWQQLQTKQVSFEKGFESLPCGSLTDLQRERIPKSWSSHFKSTVAVKMS